MDLEGRVAIVTGAGRGLGLAMARGLAAEGARVIVTSRNAVTLANAVESLRQDGAQAEGLQVQLTEQDAPARLVAAAQERFGRLDILVNNAATYVWKKLLDLSDTDWELALATNLTAPFRLIQASARYMVELGRGGSIINIGSIHGTVADGSAVAQNASKSGLEGLTRGAAEALRTHGIRVNTISPGEIIPDSYDRLSTTPADKVTQGDIAQIAVFLASDRSASLTGTTIEAFGLTRPAMRI
jgi:NAD(P)-dependent dehydrogenase (short-subunit alcohol dehydrogenase family)